MSVFTGIERECVVAARTEVASGVVALDLVAANGRDLPPWTPGSHVDAFVPGGLVRQYSLCGSPADRSRYRVAVLREPSGRGSSQVVHEQVREGDPVRIRGPRNHFPFDPTAPSVLLAGGIGVTPLLPMLAEGVAHGTDVQLLYAGRSRATMAFADALVAAHPQQVRLFPSDEGERLDVDRVVAGLPVGTALYCCGPARLLEAVELAWAYRDPERLHVERFAALEFGPPVWDQPFELELALSGLSAVVPPERSVLEVVEEQGVLLVSSCRTGTCGTCESPVLEGPVEHRDSVLTPSERAAGDTMMVCVSRAAGPRLVLDL